MMIKQMDENLLKEVYKACIEEFATKTYDQASINQISAKLSISKGTLYNYFINKEDLYFHTFEYAISLFEDELLSKVDYSDHSYFNRIRNVSKLKMDLVGRYPYLLELFTNAMKDNSCTAKKYFSIIYSTVGMRKYAEIMNGVEIKNLNHKVSQEEAMHLITSVSNGNMYLAMNNMLEIDTLVEKFENELTILEKILTED